MRRFWTTIKFVLVAIIAIVYFMAPVNQAQDKDLRYSYRFGCPAEEEYNYCPERYDSLTTDKQTYRKGEEVRLTLSDLRDFEYLVEKVEVYLKPLFEHKFELFYTENEVGPIPRENDEWVWTWDQKNAEGEQAGAGRLYIRITLNCCRNYRTYFRIELAGGTGEIEQPVVEETEPEPEPEEVVRVPGSPSRLSTDALSPSQIKITWQDNSDNESGFRIYRNGSRIATVGPNVTSYTDTGLEPGTSYSYAVTAFNDSGESGVSATVDTRTSEVVVREEPTVEEPRQEEPAFTQTQLIAGIGIVLMVMGYIYSEMG